MGVKVVATPCLQCSSMNFCSKKRALNDVVLASRSIWLGTMSSKLRKSRSFEFNSNHHHHHQQQRSSHSLSRACSVSFDSFSDEEFYRKIDDLTSKFQLESESESETELPPLPSSSSTSSMESRWFEIEMKAKSVDLPLSLRMIKKKKIQVNQQLIEASESAYCSIKKAFSSMVFIIRELHSYTLQMRELLFYEDLQGILARVQSEIHASFVWLFQQVFSHTPVLMVYIMILLANYTVHSVSNSTAIAVVPPTVEEREIAGDSQAIKSFSVSGGGKTASIGGGNGGGGKSKAVASGMDGDGMDNRTANLNRPIISDGVSTPEEVEVELWNSMVDEASRMKGEESEEVMNGEISLVSPVTAKIDGDQGYEEYFKTELFYQTGLAQEPNNVLLLGNYAQFLCLVAHDYDRAEEYFKRAISVEPKDAEAHNKYANFLWQVRNDLWAAEETFLEAISAEPTNSFYAANYAHFLWNTGGEDTCFPLSSLDDNESLD